MNDMKRSEIISDFINLIEKDCKNLLPWATEMRQKCDQATQDILHEIELGDAKHRAKLATKLAHIRKDRRYYKDIEEECTVLADWYNDEHNSTIINHLKETLGKMRKIEKYHNYRTYHPRIIKGDEE